MKSDASPRTLSFDERMAAVTRAIDRFYPYLERYLTRLAQNHADAEDLLSQLWIYVLHHFRDDQIETLTLLRRKAYQLFIDHYRKKMRSKVQIAEALPEPGMLHLGKEARSEAEEQAFKERFWEEYPVDLTSEQKEVLWLSGRYGFTIHEIADKLEVAPSTVGDWLQRGRRALDACINNSFNL
jgi:RNA polymerase sigma factor (sigma-70 family)